MALIACPECARQVSDKAEACPQCGYPVRAACSRSPAGSTSPGKEGPIAATVLPDDASAIPAIPADSQPTAATHERDVQAVRPATPRLERAAEATSRRTRLRRWIGGALILVFVVAMFGTGILGQNMFTGGLVLLSIGILLFLASYRLVQRMGTPEEQRQLQGRLAAIEEQIGRDHPVTETEKRRSEHVQTVEEIVTVCVTILVLGYILSTGSSFGFWALPLAILGRQFAGGATSLFLFGQLRDPLREKKKALAAATEAARKAIISSRGGVRGHFIDAVGWMSFLGGIGFCIAGVICVLVGMFD